jgi:hypothetical protein
VQADELAGAQSLDIEDVVLDRLVGRPNAVVGVRGAVGPHPEPARGGDAHVDRGPLETRDHDGAAIGRREELARTDVPELELGHAVDRPRRIEVAGRCARGRRAQPGQHETREHHRPPHPCPGAHCLPGGLRVLLAAASTLPHAW